MGACADFGGPTPEAEAIIRGVGAAATHPLHALGTGARATGMCAPGRRLERPPHTPPPAPGRPRPRERGTPRPD